MNQLARDELRAAWLRGQKQITGEYADEDGGLCALGVLGVHTCVFGGTVSLFTRLGITLGLMLACPLCDLKETEAGLITHLNDDHGCDFAKIAEIMP